MIRNRGGREGSHAITGNRDLSRLYIFIRQKDVKPSRPDFKVVCVFNCGVTRFNEEILLLMRVKGYFF